MGKFKFEIQVEIEDLKDAEELLSTLREIDWGGRNVWLSTQELYVQLSEPSEEPLPAAPTE